MLTKAMLIGGALALAGAANAGILYSQTWDGSGNLYGSQNDVGNFGAFVTTYDDFTLSRPSRLTAIDVTGCFFNPPTVAPVSQFTLTLYADAGGAPGVAIASGVFGGAGTYLGSPGGYPIYAYAFDLPQVPVAAGVYWFSAVADLGYPPEWGVSTSAQGDGAAYQCFFTACATLTGANLAFDVVGVPEPSAWTLMVLGLGGLGVALRSRRKAVAA